MKERITFLCLILGVFLIGHAQRVEKEVARNIGIDFLANKKLSSNPIQNRMPSNVSYELAYTATKNGKDCCYVYNCSSGGFVIVSADSRTCKPVLGYSTTGSFNFNRLDENARHWIDSYAEQISKFDMNNDDSAISYRPCFVKEVKPLLGDNLWHQGSPYNMLCPEVDGERALTGCVANAMAQIMLFHQWPEKGNGYVSYEWKWNGTRLSANLSDSKYQWDIIKNEYQPDDKDESAQAVALLLRDAGYSMQMNYMPGTSGAYAEDIDNAFKTYFDYCGIHIFSSSVNNRNGWDSMLQKEISEGRPVIYSGDSSNLGRHSFVCDGCDGEGYFHFNFGWHGESNGYYLTSANLYPENQLMVFALAPRHENPNIYWFIGEDGLKINPYENNFDIKAFVYTSMSTPNPEFDFAMAIENTSTGVITYDYLCTYQYVNMSYSPDGTNLEDGIYRFYPVGKYTSTDPWQKVIYPEGLEYIELEVKDRKIILGDGNVFQWTIDGNTYRQISDETVELISIVPDSEGTVRIPYSISIDGKELRVTLNTSVFNDQPELKTLIVDDLLVEICGCESLSTVVYLSPSGARGRFYDCPSLTKVILPENLAYYNVSGADNVEIIDFPNTNPCLKINPGCLNSSTVYVLHSTTPPAMYGSQPPIDKNLITFHIPNGYKMVYENHGFTGYNLIESNEIVLTNTVEYGYNIGRELHPFLFGFGYSSPGELSIMLDQEILEPYIGKKITAVNYYVSSGAEPSYIFVADTNPGFLDRSLIDTVIGDSWQTFSFKDPYVITGEPVYAGVGFENRTEATFTADYEVGDKYFFRGDFSNNDWMPVGLVCTPYKLPVALSITIEGEDMPIDMHIHKIDCSGKKTTHNESRSIMKSVAADESVMVEGDMCEFLMKVQNRSTEKVDGITVAVQFNDDKTLELDVPCHMGPNMASFVQFSIPFEDMPAENLVSIDIVKVNGKSDEIPHPVTLAIENVNPYLIYSKTNVVEGHFWRNDYRDDSNRIIHGINEVIHNHPDAAIGILVSHDFWNSAENYGCVAPPEGYISDGEVFAHFEVLRKDDYYSQLTPAFDAIFNVESLSYGIIEQTRALLKEGRCDVSSSVQIGYDAEGKDFRIAYVLLENGDMLTDWDGEQTHSIARGIYPDRDGVVLLPDEVTRERSYDVNFSFIVPDFVQNVENLEVVALLFNKRGEIINADKSKVIDKDAGVPDIKDLNINMPFDVYTHSGIKIRQAQTNLENLPSGLYIVRQNTKSFKIKKN